MLRLLLVQLALVGVWAESVLPVYAQATPSAARTEESVGTGPVRTDVRYFLPFGPDGFLSTLTVRQEVTGDCHGESNADIGRPDAWFCIADDGEIYDPCFENPFGSPDGPAELACVSTPWDTEVVRFTTTDPLLREKDSVDSPGTPLDQPVEPGAIPIDPIPESEIDPRDIPWALELATGERCVLLTGATAVYAGQRINYGCEGGGTIFGDTQRTGDIWLVNFLAEGSTASTLAEVANVWT